MHYWIYQNDCINIFFFQQEIEKRKKAEAAAKDALSNARKQAFIGGPDFEVSLLYFKQCYYLNYNDNNNGNLTIVLFCYFPGRATLCFE